MVLRQKAVSDNTQELEITTRCRRNLFRFSESLRLQPRVSPNNSEKIRSRATSFGCSEDHCCLPRLLLLFLRLPGPRDTPLKTRTIHFASTMREERCRRLKEMSCKRLNRHSGEVS